jgi:hypothetical protein
MRAKLTISDRCGAFCTTCPQWQTRPQNLMTPQFLRRVLDALWPHIDCLHVNGTGDYLSQPNHQEYSDILAEYWHKGGVYIEITTAGAFAGELPRITASAIICSLNATTPEMFDKHIGIAGGLTRVVKNIRGIIATHGAVEIHSLKWAGNPNPEEALLNFFGDTHARIRISEKVENQRTIALGLPDLQIARVPCDYLDMIIVNSAGEVRQCAHDWNNLSVFGNVFNLDACTTQRDVIRDQHKAGVYPGICAACNYNIAQWPAIYYIK